MDTRLLTYLQADDNEHALGLCYDQPAAPSADLLCVLKHLTVLARVNRELLALIDQCAPTVPEPHKSRMCKAAQRISEGQAA